MEDDFIALRFPFIAQEIYFTVYIISSVYPTNQDTINKSEIVMLIMGIVLVYIKYSSSLLNHYKVYVVFS